MDLLIDRNLTISNKISSIDLYIYFLCEFHNLVEFSEIDIKNNIEVAGSFSNEEAVINVPDTGFAVALKISIDDDCVLKFGNGIVIAITRLMPIQHSNALKEQMKQYIHILETAQTRQYIFQMIGPMLIIISTMNLMLIA